MNREYPEETRPTFGQRLGRGLLWLLGLGLRLFFVVLLGIALGVGVFYGIVALYNQYIYPVQVHSIRISQMETRQAEVGVAVTREMNDMYERLDMAQLRGDESAQTAAALATRLATVVGAQEALTASLEDLQADLASVQTAQQATQADLASLEATGEPLQAALEAVQTAQKRVQSALNTVQSEQATLQSAVEALRGEVEAVETAMTEAAEKAAALEAGSLNLEAIASLRRDLTLIKATELLTRARVLLVQSNYGLAQIDLQAARDLLVSLQVEVSAVQAQAIAAIVARLDGALENLPNAPVAAADELEGAWQLLMVGLPSEVSATPTLEVTSEITATASPTPTVTGTVTPTPGS